MRCFLAIEVSNKIKEKSIELIKTIKKTALRGKFVEEANLHVTLKFLGEIKLNQIEDVKELVNRLNPQKFILNFSGVGVYPNKDSPRVLWIGVDGGPELLRISKVLSGKDPHLTLARIKSWNPEFIDWINKHKNDEFGSMKIEEITLFESTLSEKGPKYTKIWSYKL